MPAMTTTSSTIFTARPAAAAPVDGDAGELLDRVLSALERDDRAIAPACSYDYDAGRIECTFQLALTRFLADQELLPEARSVALHVFDEALAHAGVAEPTSALAVVAGDDPERLPGCRASTSRSSSRPPRSAAASA